MFGTKDLQLPNFTTRSLIADSKRYSDVTRPFTFFLLKGRGYARLVVEINFSQYFNAEN